MTPMQLLCLFIVMGFSDYLLDRTKEKKNGMILMLVDVSLLVIAFALNSIVSLVLIGVINIINVWFIGRSGKKNKLETK